MNMNTTKNVTTSLEWLQETVEAATKSKVSQQTQMINDINFMWMMSNVNIYELPNLRLIHVFLLLEYNQFRFYRQ